MEAHPFLKNIHKLVTFEGFEVHLDWNILLHEISSQWIRNSSAELKKIDDPICQKLQIAWDTDFVVILEVLGERIDGSLITHTHLYGHYVFQGEVVHIFVHGCYKPEVIN